MTYFNNLMAVQLQRAKVEGCVHFEYDDLKKATKDFDQRPVGKGGCKLGEGGFGPVYKAKLKCTEVAIKVLKLETVIGWLYVRTVG